MAAIVITHQASLRRVPVKYKSIRLFQIQIIYCLIKNPMGTV